MPVTIDPAERAELRREMLAHAPWLAEVDVGPQSVDAGMCDRCTALPRLLPTCGPDTPGSLCAPCAHVIGDDGWCEGHQQTGADARAWARSLPDEWAPTVILWWIATGEIRSVEAVRPDMRPHMAALPAPLARYLD